MLFKFRKIESSLCSPCNLKAETPLWNYLWDQLRFFNSLSISPLTSQSAIFA